ncbi:MAG: site-2 protease family protein [Selenomonadaceae bacterium]
MFGSDMIFGIPGLIIAMTIHEYAHARVANSMGDFTPRMTGRLTLNPIAHIDPIGLLMLFFVQFGWAKPVMINPRNFKNWKQGEILVSLAGPAANLLMAFTAMVLMAVLANIGVHERWLRVVLYLVVLYNINFAIFNMIPIPPLDGSKILMAYLPGELAYKLQGLERYSFIVFIIMIATPILSIILVPIQHFILSIMSLIVSFIF